MRISKRILASSLLLALLASAPIAWAQGAFFGQNVYRAFTLNHTGQSNTISGNTIAATLNGTPATGDLVVCWTNSFNQTIVLNTVKDGNANSYLITTPNSPYRTALGGGNSQWMHYWVVNAAASATITVTFNTTPAASSLSLFCFDSSVQGGAAVLDTDVAGSGTTGTAINVPTLLTNYRNELLYSGFVVANGTWSSTNSPWTSVAGVERGNQAAYILNASSPTAVNFTGTVSSPWDSMGVSFYIQ